MEPERGLGLPPLSVYVHLPWCVRKCPYCDFNSHTLREELPAEAYAAAVIRDLESELPLVWGRPVQSIFFGGGTPSLFSAEHFGQMIEGFRRLLPVNPAAEITLEANPGTIERDSFARYAEAGVNRVSLGVQSFEDRLLENIGRIHGRAEIDRSLRSIQSAGIGNFNIDLMFALPGQSMAAARRDVAEAIRAGPAHISHYRLTLEPHTAFYASPPPLPDDDEAWEMQEACAEILSGAGFEQYEISAWARPGRRCRHNVNYWKYGDYVGVGAGAHGKITLPGDGSVVRRVRERGPAAWLRAVDEGQAVVAERRLGADERVFEFFLNHLRLREEVRQDLFTARTGGRWHSVLRRVEPAVRRGLLQLSGEGLRSTDLGWRFVNDVQELFLPDGLSAPAAPGR